MAAGIRFADNIPQPNKWIDLSDSVTEPARVNTEFDMAPPVGQMPAIDDEQHVSRLEPYGSDLSLNPVTPGCPPREPRYFISRTADALSVRLDRYLFNWQPLTSLSQRVLCSRVNRRESTLPNAHRQLIFAAFASYASEAVSTVTRAAAVALKMSCNWKA